MRRKIKLLTLSAALLPAILMACNQNATPAPIKIITATAPAAQLPVLPTQPALVAQTLPPPDNSIFTENQTAGCEFDVMQAHIRNTVDAKLDWETGRVEVEQTIDYRNDTGNTLQRLVFRAEPNRLESFGVLTLQKVMDEQGVTLNDVTLENTRLTVTLPQDLLPGCLTRLRLLFSIQIPSNAETLGGRFGYLGYTERQVNLGHWLFTPAYYDTRTGDWITPPSHTIGEQTMPEAADYTVTLTVEGAPGGLEIAVPGKMTRQIENTWTFEIQKARDFALSLSPYFEKTSIMAEDILVELYYFAGSQAANLNSAGHALGTAQQALILFETLFGGYPYERMVVVEGDFPDGMEFSGLVFVGSSYFTNWQGTEQTWLTIITAHEISHQWWYSLVGSDQSLSPYLDEALAVYSELLFFERYYPQSVDWWWNFRVLSHPTDAPVDSTVYDFGALRPYIDAVYLRGALMLQNVRDRVGEDMFLNWLKRYASQNRERVALAVDFWGSLPEAEYALISDIRSQYLKNSDVLPTQAVSAEEVP